MGVVVNAVVDVRTGLSQLGGGGPGVAGEVCGVISQAGLIRKWAGNAAFSLGSTGCPIVSECRDIGEGIA